MGVDFLLDFLQDQLIQEAHVMKGFRHPNLLMLHCSFIHGSDLWLVMPFIAGGSLANLISSKYDSPFRPYGTTPSP